MSFDLESDSGGSRGDARASSEDPESDLDFVHQSEGGENLLCVGKDGIEKIVCTVGNDDDDDDEEEQQEEEESIPPEASEKGRRC